MFNDKTRVLISVEATRMTKQVQHSKKKRKEKKRKKERPKEKKKLQKFFFFWTNFQNCLKHPEMQKSKTTFFGAKGKKNLRKEQQQKNHGHPPKNQFCCYYVWFLQQNVHAPRAKTSRKAKMWGRKFWCAKKNFFSSFWKVFQMIHPSLGKKKNTVTKKERKKEKKYESLKIAWNSEESYFPLGGGVIIHI